MANPYDVLGLSPDAAPEDIKSAFKKLARKYHPDLNPSREAEARFKDVNEAYDIIGNAERRSLFDEFGEVSLEPGFDPEMARSYQAARAVQERFQAKSDPMSGFHDFFGDMFGGGFATDGGHTNDRGYGHSAAPSQGQDIQTEGRIDPVIAFIGGNTQVSVFYPDGQTRPVTVRVRAGAETGDVVTLRGMGASGRNGGPPGDLHLQLSIPEHPVFKRNGDDIEVTVPITVLEAMLGGTIEVPTPQGVRKVNLPAGVGSSRMRLRGRGVQRPHQPGNLILHLQPQVPKHPTQEMLDAARAIEQGYGRGVRADLFR